VLDIKFLTSFFPQDKKEATTAGRQVLIGAKYHG